MKKLSQPLSTLWESDPNKSKWAMMTKAWSIIRDQIGKGKAPLDVFFKIVCPLLNIPSPQTYFEELGWYLYPDNNGNPQAKCSPELAKAAQPGEAEESYSVEDLIHFSQTRGYAPSFRLRPDSASSTLMIASTRAIERRAADRSRRQAQRQLARNTGISALFQAPISINDNGSVHWPQPQFENSSADERLYQEIQNIATNTQAMLPVAETQQPDSIMQNIADIQSTIDFTGTEQHPSFFDHDATSSMDYQFSNDILQFGNVNEQVTEPQYQLDIETGAIEPQYQPEPEADTLEDEDSAEEGFRPGADTDATLLSDLDQQI